MSQYSYSDGYITHIMAPTDAARAILSQLHIMSMLHDVPAAKPLDIVDGCNLSSGRAGGHLTVTVTKVNGSADTDPKWFVSYQDSINERSGSHHSVETEGQTTDELVAILVSLINKCVSGVVANKPAYAKSVDKEETAHDAKN